VSFYTPATTKAPAMVLLLTRIGPAPPAGAPRVDLHRVHHEEPRAPAGIAFYGSGHVHGGIQQLPWVRNGLVAVDASEGTWSRDSTDLEATRVEVHLADDAVELILVLPSNGCSEHSAQHGSIR